MDPVGVPDGGCDAGAAASGALGGDTGCMRRCFGRSRIRSGVGSSVLASRSARKDVEEGWSWRTAAPGGRSCPLDTGGGDGVSVIRIRAGEAGGVHRSTGWSGRSRRRLRCGTGGLVSAASYMANSTAEYFARRVMPPPCWRTYSPRASHSMRHRVQKPQSSELCWRCTRSVFSIGRNSRNGDTPTRRGRCCVPNPRVIRWNACTTCRCWWRGVRRQRESCTWMVIFLRFRRTLIQCVSPTHTGNNHRRHFHRS